MGDVQIWARQKIVYNHQHWFREWMGQMMYWALSNSKWLIIKFNDIHVSLVTMFYGAILLIGNKYTADVLQLEFVQFCFEMLLV